MIYVVTVERWDEYDECFKKNNLFVAGEKFIDVVNEMDQYYNEKSIESISIKSFSPDNFLEFESDKDDHIFSMIKETLGERVVW